jgi:hypothetical protein
VFWPFFCVGRYPIFLFLTFLHRFWSFMNPSSATRQHVFCMIVSVRHKGHVLNCKPAVCLFSLLFYFGVTLPCATQLIICVSPNGGKLKQNRVLILLVKNDLLCFFYPVWCCRKMANFLTLNYVPFLFSQKKMSSFTLWRIKKIVRSFSNHLLMCTTSYPPHLSQPNLYISLLLLYFEIQH